VFAVGLLTWWGPCSDGTLNPGGVRFGSAELYNVLSHVPSVTDSLAVGQPWEGDERVVLFVVLAAGATWTAVLEEDIRYARISLCACMTRRCAHGTRMSLSACLCGVFAFVRMHQRPCVAQLRTVHENACAIVHVEALTALACATMPVPAYAYV
jgi:hypothetical protein